MADEQPATEQPAPEEKPKTEEEEFSLRFDEEKAADAEREKEIRYQLFRVRNEFGLKADDLEMWRRGHPLGIELVWITRKPFIYRNLALGEYTKIAEECQDLQVLRRRVTMAAVLWPKMWKTESDLLRGPAGIPQTITESCLRTSGFEEVLAFPV